MFVDVQCVSRSASGLQHFSADYNDAMVPQSLLRACLAETLQRSAVAAERALQGNCVAAVPLVRLSIMCMLS